MEGTRIGAPKIAKKKTIIKKTIIKVKIKSKKSVIHPSVTTGIEVDKEKQIKTTSEKKRLTLKTNELASGSNHKLKLSPVSK